MASVSATWQEFKAESMPHQVPSLDWISFPSAARLTTKKGLIVSYTIRIVNVMDGPELLKIRKSMNLTQEQMADQIGVRANTVARWERDELRISEPIKRLIHLLAKISPSSKRKNKMRRS